MIFTFHQSYYIKQLLAIDHDCEVPVDKNGSVKSFTPPPLTAPKGSKVKYLNFAVTKAIIIPPQTLFVVGFTVFTLSVRL